MKIKLIACVYLYPKMAEELICILGVFFSKFLSTKNPVQ